MPDSPAYLARDRAAYVGGHSFVLLIGLLAVTGAVGFFHAPNGPVYLATRHAGAVFQWATFAALGLGGVLVIIGLTMLHLRVEAAGHVLICVALVMNGVMTALTTPAGFDWTLAAFGVAVTTICIAFRLWALVQASRLRAEIQVEMAQARRVVEEVSDP